MNYLVVPIIIGKRKMFRRLHYFFFDSPNIIFGLRIERLLEILLDSHTFYNLPNNYSSSHRKLLIASPSAPQPAWAKRGTGQQAKVVKCDEIRRQRYL